MVMKMKQCEICINKPYKDKLVCCSVAELHNAFNNVFKLIPVIRDFVKPFECGWRIIDKKYSGFPEDFPPYCRCSVKYEVQNES